MSPGVALVLNGSLTSQSTTRGIHVSGRAVDGDPATLALSGKFVHYSKLGCWELW